jgi:4-amino-4-deoxychorismate lyase
MTLRALAVTGRGLVDPDAPAVYADDEAFLRGRAAFETIRLYGGRPFRLDDHLSRLVESARRLGLPPVDRAALLGLASETLAEAEVADGMLRIYWTPGREGQSRPLGIVLVRDLPSDLEELRTRGLRLVSVPVGGDQPGLLGGVKSTSYALNMVAVDEARGRGADDAVLVGVARVILEGPTSNVWWRRRRMLFTPALELGILAGVTRAVLLGLAPDLGYEVREGAFALEELTGSEEAFTSSSVREVMPVAEVDGTRFALGPAARELQAALRAAATTPRVDRARAPSL